ncbi:MAG TPA: NAD(P)-binding domain-containing protein, partial [Cyclobacteriaceae bacterium]
MKIGIIGSGNMGRTLGLLWMEKGHQVFFGSRNEKDISFIKEISGKVIRHGTIEEASLFGDVLLYSLRDTLPSTILDRTQWTNKIIIDCNNGPIPADFNFPPLVESFSEMYQKDVPEANVVKAFNCIAQETLNHDYEVIKKS